MLQKNDFAVLLGPHTERTETEDNDFKKSNALSFNTNIPFSFDWLITSILITY